TSMGHVLDHLPQGIPAARDFEPDVKALGHSEFVLNVAKVMFARVERYRGSHLAGEVEAVGVQVRHDDMACSSMANDRGRHAANWACPGYEDVLAQYREGERGVHSVSERVEYGGDLFVDPWPVTPDVRHGQDDVLGERAGTLHAE